MAAATEEIHPLRALSKSQFGRIYQLEVVEALREFEDQGVTLEELDEALREQARGYEMPRPREGPVRTVLERLVQAGVAERSQDPNERMITWRPNVEHPMFDLCQQLWSYAQGASSSVARE